MLYQVGQGPNYLEQSYGFNTVNNKSSNSVDDNESSRYSSTSSSGLSGGIIAAIARILRAICSFFFGSSSSSSTAQPQSTRSGVNVSYSRRRPTKNFYGKHVENSRNQKENEYLLKVDKPTKKEKQSKSLNRSSLRKSKLSKSDRSASNRFIETPDGKKLYSELKSITQNPLTPEAIKRRDEIVDIFYQRGCHYQRPIPFSSSPHPPQI